MRRTIINDPVMLKNVEKNLDITKPRCSEHILPVPRPFRSLYRRSTVFCFWIRVACVTSVSAWVRRESWDARKKILLSLKLCRAKIRSETLAKEAKICASHRPPFCIQFHQSRMKRVRNTTSLISLSIGTPSIKGVTAVSYTHLTLPTSDLV